MRNIEKGTMYHTSFVKAYKREVLKVRVFSFLLAAGLVPTWVLGTNTVRAMSVLWTVIIILVLATHYSEESITYRVWKKVDKIFKV